MKSTDSASSNPQDEEEERNLGPQPLDALMLQHELCNHDLVAASPEPMTHKAVARARKGRRLTRHMQERMVVAVNLLLTQRDAEHCELRLEQVFSYKG